MRVLGIMDSHTAAAAVVEDGRVLAAVREETLSREKGYARFPTQAVESVLRLSGVAGRDIDAVAFGIRADTFDTPAFQQGERGLKRRGVAAVARLLPGPVIRADTLRAGWVGGVGALRRRQTLADHGPFMRSLGLPLDAVHFIDHHRCHALTALLLDPAQRDAAGALRDGLVVVADGYGDGDAGGVWEARGGAWTQLQRVPFIDSVGAVYSRATRALGMKPWEHEYKVMGLAAYGGGPAAEAVAARLRARVGVVHGRLSNRRRLSGPLLERAVARDLAGVRFDHAAAGLQRFLEETLLDWIGDQLRRTGHRRLGLAGGVFLNVKANHRLARALPVDELFVFPPAGDESASVGAALAAWVDRVGIDTARRAAPALSTLYWGPAIDETRAEASLRASGLAFSRPDDLADRVATALDAGGIVGRCTGRLEFGPRALGHRSILCRPDDLAVRDRLNRQVKRRDFWMPFAATVLAEHTGRYLVGEPTADAAYMIRTFDTTPLGRRHLAAAVHPADGTTRPQVLSAAQEPDWHATVSAFADRSGMGAVLNTSFNEHGEPIVATADDALATFRRCGLDHLQLGPFWVERPEAP